ncbi:MAG: hypothetical protein U1C55_03115 [Smithellaceae bacterium]|nr:hypothetical protein [Smithellaceae bacterium]
MAIFQSDADRRCYLQYVKEETERFGAEILTWCLMTNHVHFIAVPPELTSFARGFGEAHRRYTRMKNFLMVCGVIFFRGDSPLVCWMSAT